MSNRWAYWAEPAPPEHGTCSRYLAGCRCIPCRTEINGRKWIQRETKQGRPGKTLDDYINRHEDNIELPEDLVTIGPWRHQGACVDADPDLFFPEHNPRQAKAICVTCPVIIECLEHALTAPERWGVWGGKSEKERQQLRRRLRDAI